MSRDIEAMPLWAKLVAYAFLGAGFLASWVFVGWYVIARDWSGTEMGRHIVAFSSVVGAFFTLYLVLAIWPTFPLRSVVRFVLLVILVSVVVWRLWIFYRDDRDERRKKTGTADARP